MYMFYQMATDAAQLHSMKFDSPRVREKVYLNTIQNTYRHSTSSPVQVTTIPAPVLSHKGLYDAIMKRYTFRPIILYNNRVSFYAWLPLVPGATHISMSSQAFDMIVMIVSGNPKFQGLSQTIAFDEPWHGHEEDDESHLINYPKTVIPRINSAYRSNIFLTDIFSTIVMILNFMSIRCPNPKKFRNAFLWYFVNSRIEIVTLPKDMVSATRPFNLILDPDTPVAFKQTEHGICDAVMMNPDAVNSVCTLVISRAKDTIALLHLTAHSFAHQHGVDFFNENVHELVDQHLSMNFRLDMQLLSEFGNVPPLLPSKTSP